jgi:hypothetical protein
VTGRLAALVATAVLAGCGADDEPAPVRTENDDSPSLAPTATATPSATPAASATPPTATAPSAPAPPPDAGVPEGHGAEDQEGGAGDEEAARVPVSLVVDGEGITPPVVSVPAFLALEIRVRNDLPRAVRIRIARTGVAFRVPARSARARAAGGLGRGRYSVDAGKAGRAQLEVGAEPGP